MARGSEAEAHESMIQVWATVAARHLRGRPCLLGRDGQLLPSAGPAAAWHVFDWLHERAEESVTMGVDRWAFRG